MLKIENDFWDFCEEHAINGAQRLDNDQRLDELVVQFVEWYEREKDGRR